MDVQESSTYNGAQVQGWQCNNSDAQGWTYPSSGQTGSVKSLFDGGNSWCLDVAGSNFTVGAKVWLWTCNGTAAQKFTRLSTGELKVPFTGSPGLCVSEDRNPSYQGMWLINCGQSEAAQKWQNRSGTMKSFPASLN
ncbi:ricin-type beta-trefoil lectin domain protein [Streptomyces sp. NPDC055709]